MPAKKNLAEMLSGETAKPNIRRGQGVRLSTEDSQNIHDGPAETTPGGTERTIAQSHERTNAQEQPKRINRGYKLREDLIKAYKRIALEEDRKLYEVMEEALEAYLEQRKGGTS